MANRRTIPCSGSSFLLVNEINYIRGQSDKENELKKHTNYYQFTQKDLAITGADLLKWTGETAGPWVKETLDKVECQVLLGKINNEKIRLKRWLGYHEE